MHAWGIDVDIQCELFQDKGQRPWDVGYNDDIRSLSCIICVFCSKKMYNMRAKLNYHDLDFDLATK